MPRILLLAVKIHTEYAIHLVTTTPSLSLFTQEQKEWICMHSYPNVCLVYKPSPSLGLLISTYHSNILSGSLLYVLCGVCVCVCVCVRACVNEEKREMEGESTHCTYNPLYMRVYY